MSEKYSRRRQNNQDAVPSTSRGIVHKHSRSQRSSNTHPTVNDSREAYKLADSDSSDIENDDINIPKYSKSKSSSQKHGVKFSSRDRNLFDDFDSEDEDDVPIRSKNRTKMLIKSDSDDDSDSDVQLKRKKGLGQKKPILESEDSETEEDINPKFKAKKCRLMSFSDDNESTPHQSNTSNSNGNSSGSAPRPLSIPVGNNSTHMKAKRNRPRRSPKYFLDDETNRLSSDWSSVSESEWDANWENDWEEHWQKHEPDPRSHSTPAKESEKQSKTEAKDSKGAEKSAVAENADSNDDSKANCPICLLDFTDQKLGTPASCEHVFCLDCILEWCKVVNTCPADRKEFLSIHVREELGGDIVETLPVQDRTQNAESSADDTHSCELCGRSDGEDTMLLCDQCDLGYHMDCLNPPLTEVPPGDWMCPDCRAGVIPGIGVNFLTLFSVFHEILGERGLLQSLSGTFTEDLLVGANFFERHEDTLPMPRENGHRRERLNTLPPVEEEPPRRRRRRRPSSHPDTEERQRRPSTRGTSSRANDAEPSSSGHRTLQRRSNVSRSTRSTSSSTRNRRSSSRGPSSAGDATSRRSPAQGNQSSPRDRHFARHLRRHTHTNFRSTRPRRSSSENGSIRLIRRRWVDTSSSDE